MAYNNHIIRIGKYLEYKFSMMIRTVIRDIAVVQPDMK